MANKVKGISIEIGAETKKFKNGINELKKETKSTQKELNEVNKALKLDPKNTDLLRQKQQLLNKSLEEQRKCLNDLKAEKEKADRAMANGTEINQENYRILQREIAATEGNIKKLSKETSNFAKSGEAIKDVGGKISNAGKKLSVVSGVAAAGIGSAIVSASKFEDAFAKVTTIADTTEVSSEDLKKSIIDLSNETGIAATDIADNVYNAISAGQKTGDAVNFVSNATKLAKAGFTDSSSALDILTTAMNAYGLEASEVNKVSDLLIGTQNLGKTTVAELSSSMGKVIPTAKANNVELEQLCTGYALLTSNGIATAESTTYMNSMLNELGKGGTNVDKILREQTGASFSELSKQGKSLGDVLQILKDYADKNNQSFGDLWSSSEAGKAGLVLLGDSADTFNGKLKEMNGQTGATDEAFDKLDTSSNKVKKATNQLKNALTDLGGNALEALAPIIDGLLGKIKDFVSWFSQLSEGQKKTIVIIGGIIAIVPPLLLGLGSLVTAVGVLTGAIGGLNLAFLASPVTWVILGITALVATIVILWKKCEAFRNAITSIFDFIKNNWKDLLLSLVNPIGGVIKLLYNNNSKFRKWADDVIQTVKDGFSNAWEAMKNIGKNLIDGIVNGIKGAIKNVTKATQQVVDKIKSIFTGKKGFDEHSPSKWAEKVGEFLMKGFANGITSDMSAEEAVKKKIENLKNFITDNLNNINSASDISNAWFELWQAENPNATEDETTRKRVEMNARQLYLAKDKAELLHEAYVAYRDNFGENATETKDALKEYIQAQTTYKNLENTQNTDMGSIKKADEEKYKKYNDYKREYGGYLRSFGYNESEIDAYARKSSEYNGDITINNNYYTPTVNSRIIKNTQEDSIRGLVSG